MHYTMPETGLQLTLEAGQSLPVHLCWRVNDGYLRAIGKTDLAETFTLGIWGPGEIVMPQLLNPQPMELRALSRAWVHQWNPSPEEQQHCSRVQIKQMGMLLQLTRVRPVEARLFNLLVWLSERFGSDTEQECLLPLEAMNLTHRQLAEMASVSRVTVTKALGQFRQKGWLKRVKKSEVLSQEVMTRFRRER
jgi:hypothetical protein